MLGLASLVGLVEDSDEDHAAFVRLARKEVPGVEIVRWSSAEALLDELVAGDEGETGARTPDVLVLDLNLPGIDGAELVRRLRGGERTRALPAFVLSGSERQADIDRCYAAGANAYLTKPGSIAELRALIQMLFRTLSTFKAPSAPAVGTPAISPDQALVDQQVIDEERERYEAELRQERDHERAGRERAEALQRLTLRLANAGDAADVERLLLEALTAGRDGVTARIVAGSTETDETGPLVMPDPFGDGTIAMLPLHGHANARHATVRLQTDAELSENDEAFLHSAVAVAGQALGRVGRVAQLARRARGGATDLPVDRWWDEAIGQALTASRHSGRPLSVVAILPAMLELEGQDALTPVEIDEQILAIIDAWRANDHDLLSPSGAERWVALIHAKATEADALAGRVAATAVDAPFIWGTAEWDRRETAADLLSRAITGLVRTPGAAAAE